MWAQRIANTSPDHDAASFVGETADDVADQINDRCWRFAVRVAHVAYSVVVTPNRVQHYALVIFERER